MLITSHDDWPVAEVVAGYRSQSEAEFSFRQMKDPHVVSFSPMFHWTEHNIRVHMFTCVLALQIAHLMRLKARRAGLDLSVRALLGELAGIDETILLYQAERASPGPPHAHRHHIAPGQAQRHLRPRPLRAQALTWVIHQSSPSTTADQRKQDQDQLIPETRADLQERWGTDLLEALVALDRAGVDHRDIKPANLGVREGRSDRAKHLVLFDFSLSRAGAAAVTAGTPPYLDPFLDNPERGRFDSAAERYSAAVVLVRDGHRRHAAIRRRAVRPGLAARGSGHRAGHVRPGCRPAAGTVLPQGPGPRRRPAATTPRPTCSPPGRPSSRRCRRRCPMTPTTAPPRRSRTRRWHRPGLSARALSALEPFGVRTVADLVAVDPVRLNRMSGVADITRREVKSRATQWRRQFAATVTGRGAPGQAGTTAGSLPDPVAAAELLAGRAGTQRAQSRRRSARLLLGLEPQSDPFATQAELSTILQVSAARTAQQVGALQQAWADDEQCRDLLDALAAVCRAGPG